jgi:AraC-like DNA-binding protein
MNRLATVSTALISAILDGAALSQADKTAILADAGLGWETVRDVNARTSILVLSRLWKGVLRATRDPFAGLTIGKTIPGERFGLAVHAAKNSEDFGGVLRRFVKYASLINAMIRCDLKEDAEPARFTMKFSWDVLDLERHAVDITFAALTVWARRQVGEAFRLREVRDLELGRILERHADTELASIPSIAGLPERIAQILERELRRGNKVDLPCVSAELRMAPRAIQRKLSESATSFSTLLDDARRALAPALLAEPTANVGQVAFKLGYAEPTAFIRAFKKWYGVTPGNYQKA